MSDRTLEELIRELPDETHSCLSRFVRRLVHDLNSPISTVNMEVFSARILLEQLDRQTGKDPAVEKLAAVFENLEVASGLLSDLVTRLSRIEAEAPARAPEGEGDESP